MERTWDDVLRPVLGTIGDRWSELPHGIAVEHLLSHIAAAALEATIPIAAPGRPAALLACVLMEELDLPLVALAAALGRRGVATTLLGAATPTYALARAMERGQPSVVMLLALLPVLADPGVLTALPPTDLLVAAGPGWEGSALPGGVERVDDLPGALQMIGEALGPG